MIRLSTELSSTVLQQRYRESAQALARCTPDANARFDIQQYSKSAIERATRVWRYRMTAEHQSIAAFSSLGLQLMEVDVPLDIKSIVLTMAHDELRHTDLCGRVVQILGATAVCEVEAKAVLMPKYPGISPEEQVLRNVIYSNCGSELVNTARFVDALEIITDPYIRDVTRQLLADEVMHGQFGFLYLQCQAAWLRAHPEVCQSLSEYLKFGLALLEQRFALDPNLGTPPNEEELALGVPDRRRWHDVFYQTVEHALLPGLEQFGIEATKAWQQRSLKLNYTDSAPLNLD